MYVTGLEDTRVVNNGSRGETSGLCRGCKAGSIGVSGSCSSARMSMSMSMELVDSSAQVVGCDATGTDGHSRSGSDRRKLISTADHTVELVLRLLLSCSLFHLRTRSEFELFSKNHLSI
jgi:hypothetical protein